MNKKIYLILSLFLLIPIVIIVCLSIGGNFINPGEILGDDKSSKILLELRFFRILNAFIVGGALAVAGVAYQAVLRNPLAEPYILGISGGASLGAVIAITTGLVAESLIALPLFSFCGAILVLAVVLTLSRGAGAEYSTNILLSGIIAGTVCSSFVLFMKSQMNRNALRSVFSWSLGCLEAPDRPLLYIVLGITCAGVILLFLFGRDADTLSMGEEAAFHFGISPRVSGFLILGTASLLTAAAVAVAGIIGFVGLIVPHTLRRLFGATHRQLFPLAFFTGGLFLVICDTVGRSVLFPQEIPVGVITAALGGPFFIWLINKRQKK